MSLVTCHHPYYNSHNFFHRLSILNPESGSALSPQCLSISLTLKRLWLCALILLPPACLESNWSWSKCLSSAIRGEPSGAPGSWLTWCHLGLLQPSSCSRWKVAVSVTLLFEFWIVELFTVVIFRWRMLSWWSLHNSSQIWGTQTLLHPKHFGWGTLGLFSRVQWQRDGIFIPLHYRILCCTKLVHHLSSDHERQIEIVSY